MDVAGEVKGSVSREGVVNSSIQKTLSPDKNNPIK
jgi:hypothetical protein